MNSRSMNILINVFAAHVYNFFRYIPRREIVKSEVLCSGIVPTVKLVSKSILPDYIPTATNQSSR